MQKVLILLSSYNGEKYLSEQIDSLLGQKGVETQILVRDDGSKDNTLSILDKYKNKTGKVDIIKGQNCGSAKSFCILMKEAYKFISSYDFFCFCDQDDVWMEDKLEVAVENLSNVENKMKPSLYMGAYQMVDANLNRIPTPMLRPTINLPGAFASNCATGCTMVFNKELLAAVVGYSAENIIMHDYWMYLVCLAIGGNVFYDTTPHILYRQHGNNVIGGKKESFSKRWSIRLKKLFRKGDCYKSKLAKKLLEESKTQLYVSDRQFLEALSSCGKLSSKLRILRTKEFWKNSLDRNLQNLGLILTGKF